MIERGIKQSSVSKARMNFLTEGYKCGRGFVLFQIRILLFLFIFLLLKQSYGVETLAKDL